MIYTVDIAPLALSPRCCAFHVMGSGYNLEVRGHELHCERGAIDIAEDVGDLDDNLLELRMLSGFIPDRYVAKRLEVFANGEANLAIENDGAGAEYQSLWRLMRLRIYG